MKKPVLIVITTLVISGMFAVPAAYARQGDTSTQKTKANLPPAVGTQLPKPDPKFKGKIVKLIRTRRRITRCRLRPPVD